MQSIPSTLTTSNPAPQVGDEKLGDPDMGYNYDLLASAMLGEDPTSDDDENNDKDADQDTDEEDGSLDFEEGSDGKEEEGQPRNKKALGGGKRVQGDSGGFEAAGDLLDSLTDEDDDFIMADKQGVGAKRNALEPGALQNVSI